MLRKRHKKSTFTDTFCVIGVLVQNFSYQYDNVM